MRVIRILAVLAIAATFGLAGCGDDDDEDTAATAATTTEEAAGGGGAIEIGMTEYAFKPRDVTVGRGDTIIATNDGEMPHNYTLPEVPGEVLDRHPWLASAKGLRGGGREVATGNVDPGSSRKVRVNVAVPGGTRHLPRGKYGVICTIPGHAEQGMKGTLTVE